MLCTIRQPSKINKTKFEEVCDIELTKLPAITEKIEVNKKFYKVNGIINDNKAEGMTHYFIDCTEANKHYDDNISRNAYYDKTQNQILEDGYRRDRYGHRIIENKDGSYKTINDKGKIIREWDKDGHLIKGEPYNPIYTDGKEGREGRSYF